MKTEKIVDFLQGLDINDEVAIAELSDKIWEIGNISKIKEQVSEPVFTFQVAVNIIGNYQGGGWQYIIEEQTELLPYVSQALYDIGFATIAEATKDITRIFPLDMDYVLSLNSKQLTEVVNFMKGTHLRDYVTMENLLNYTEDEQEKLSDQYHVTIEKLDDISGKFWNYGAPDNQGWGVVSKFLEKHLQDNFWKLK